MKSVLPEADPEHDREGDQRHHAGEGELAGDGERVSAADDSERHVAHEVREQQEDERREHPRQVPLTLGADARPDHVVDEADQPFDRDLPAAGDQLPLHAAEHEEPDRAEHDEGPQGAVCEDERIVALERTEDRLDHELVHRVDIAGRHALTLLFLIGPAGAALLPRNPEDIEQPASKAEEQQCQHQPRRGPEPPVEKPADHAAAERSADHLT